MESETGRMDKFGYCQKMRILCLIEALGSGGAERQLTGLAAMLKKEGNEVRVMTWFPKDFYKQTLDDAGIEYQYIANAQKKYRRIPLLAKAVKAYHPDVVIAYSPSAAEIACVMKRIGLKYKLIVSERNTSQSNSKSEKIKFYLYRWSDWIVPNSNMQAKFIKEHYPHLMAKTRVITNFVDTDYFCPSDPGKKGGDVFRMICVGRDNPQKNQLRFIEALKILEDKGVTLKVDWYGKFESSYGQKCKERIKALNLENTIFLKGETRNVRDEYRKHDVFCLPSIYEGFPNVLCEAMSCGLPVLCSDVCDNPLIVTEGVNGYLFNPYDNKDIADKIEVFLCLNKSKKLAMGKTNRMKALQLFSSENFLRQYKELL